MIDPMHFEARSEVYERARPPYPEGLWEHLRVSGLLQPGARVLELGAGSGQATVRLVAEGARVTAVEPGRSLARRLQERLPQVKLRVATAEAVDLPRSAFDLAVAATAVHWFDLPVVLPKLHVALVPHGRFAVWRNVYGDPRVRTEFRKRVDEIVARRAATPERGPAGELDLEGWVTQLTRTGHFVAEDVQQWWWSVELDAGQIRDLFSTFSEWSEDEADQAGRAAASLGGRVTEHYSTWLIVLRRVDD